MRKCLWCKKNNVISQFDFVTTCDRCIEEWYPTRNKTSVTGEWSRHANVEKNAHSKDVLQPTNKDGTINKHFVQAHGTKSLEKELKLSSREIRENADKYG